MDFKWIVLRFKNMLVHPKAELENVRDENGMMGETYFFLFLFCLFIGLSYFGHGFSNLFSETVIWYIAVLLTTLATWLLAPKFDTKTTWAKVLKINVFSIFPLLMCIALGNLIGYKNILLGVGFIYSTYLLYNGIKIVTSPKDNQEIPYTFVVIVLAAVANYIARILIP